MDIVRRTWCEISLDNARDNFKLIKSKIGDTKLCCVVKADGYGHGAAALASLYEKAGADYLAVSNIDEAKELRDNGIKLPVLILGYTPVKNARELFELNITQTVYSLEYARQLSGMCARYNLSIKIMCGNSADLEAVAGTTAAASAASSTAASATGGR